VLIDKSPIISDIISRDVFFFVTLCKKAKEKAQEIINKKKKDVEAHICKTQVVKKRGKPYELMIEKRDNLKKLN
jgi:hypothetical protein